MLIQGDAGAQTFASAGVQTAVFMTAFVYIVALSFYTWRAYVRIDCLLSDQCVIRVILGHLEQQHMDHPFPRTLRHYALRCTILVRFSDDYSIVISGPDQLRKSAQTTDLLYSSHTPPGRMDWRFDLHLHARQS